MTAEILMEVLRERGAQDEKWGAQNHPDLTPAVTRSSLLTSEELKRAESHSRKWWLARVFQYYGVLTPDKAKDYCDAEHRAGNGSWFSIHIEELSEALEQAALGDTEKMRAELVQLAATVVAHIEAIDRRTE